MKGIHIFTFLRALGGSLFIIFRVREPDPRLWLRVESDAGLFEDEGRAVHCVAHPVLSVSHEDH